MSETMPRWMTAPASSLADQRDSGLPESRGNVQASAVTRARTAEGKKARPAGPRGFLVHRPPLGCGGATCAPSDRRSPPLGQWRRTPVRMLVRQQEDLCPNHFGEWCCPKPADAFELPVLRSGK